MFSRLYNNDSCLSMDFYFDKSVARISIALKLPDGQQNQGNQKQFDYKNQAQINLYPTDLVRCKKLVMGLMAGNANLDYKTPILRKWNENNVETQTSLYITRNSQGNPIIAIQKVVAGQQPLSWIYALQIDELEVLAFFFQESMTTLPSLGCYHYWADYMKNKAGQNGYSNSGNGNGGQPANTGNPYQGQRPGQPGIAPNKVPAGVDTFDNVPPGGPNLNQPAPSAPATPQFNAGPAPNFNGVSVNPDTLSL